ncbi:hypothetical protein GQ53DRAFT_674586 [Thozetella sp. PMI_491]|nr:hypothetical protein GQ53DRAFT_674586 [Thozetella sp. PMI_491]
MAPYASSMVLPTAVLVVDGLCLGISLIAIILRFYSRLVIRRVKMRLCDWMILATWLLAIGTTTSSDFCVTRGGLGQPLEIVTLDELVFSTKQVLVLGSLSTLAFACVKISILDLLLSIFDSVDGFRIWAIFLMVISACYGLSIFIVTWAGCQPFEANWNKQLPDYHCVDLSALYTTQAALGATLDILILLSPIPAVWSLRLKTSKKIGLTVLFTVGIGICAISLIRLWFNSRPDYQNSHFTEFLAYTAILGNLEVALSILCACLPTYPTLFAPLTQKIKSALSTMSYRRKGFGSSGSKSTGTVRLPSTADVEGDAVDKLYPLSQITNPTLVGTTRTSFEVDVENKVIHGTNADGGLEMDRGAQKIEPFSNLR